MDPIANSSLSLNRRPSNGAIIEENTVNEILHKSTFSLNNYEPKSFKHLIPQIIAVVITLFSHLLLGISLAYSAVLIPQLQEKNEISASPNQLYWIASTLSLSAPVGSLAAGYFMNSWGRILTLKTTIIPSVIGWFLCALSSNVSMMIISRIFLGFYTTYCSGPAYVYITEIARKDLRGAFISLGPATTSFGMLVGYLQGSLMHWRTLAYTCIGYSFIPFILLFFVPESPAWLVAQGRIEEARKSLEWFNRYIRNVPQGKNIADKQIELLLKEHVNDVQEEEQKSSGFRKIMKGFAKPTGYKPTLILLGLFTIQQFSGSYIFLFYSISFLQAAGTKVDPYMASIGIAVVRLVMSLANSVVMRSFKRRLLLSASSIGMGVSIFISGLFTYWIKEGTTTLTWVPVVCLLTNVLFSMFGLVTIPWTMTAEVFPLEIRSFASSFIMGAANFLMFVAVQNYGNLRNLFGDDAKLQWFFAGVSFIGAIYSLVVIPETHNKKLSEIEEYFENNTFYLSCGAKKRNRRVALIREINEEQHALKEQELLHQ